MTRKTNRVIAAAALASALAACSSAAPVASEPPKIQVSLNDATALASVTRASNTLGISLLQLTGEEAARTDQNSVFSSTSATIALAMLSEGAVGAGADALHALLGAQGQELTDAVNALSGDLAKFDGDVAKFDPKKLPETTFLHVANNLVLDDGFTVKETFTERLKEFYGSGFDSVDLGSQEGMDALSRWVKFHTGGLIEETGITPDPDLRVVLQNAVLFAGRWQMPFEAGRTIEDEFTTSSGKKLTVEMMVATMEAPTAWSGKWLAVSLPYTDGFRAIVILPPEGVDPSEITPEILAELKSGLEENTQHVAVMMPKLDIATKTDLIDPLRALGLDPIFEDGSTFAGMSDAALVVDQVVQQARLQIDEEGTVAAAVTEVGMTEGAFEVPDPMLMLKADRPYLFMIERTETGLDLFTAAIRDPLAE